MNVFTSLSERTKVFIVAGSLFIITLSLGLLVFGENITSAENDLINNVKDAVKADLLYVQPGQGGH